MGLYRVPVAMVWVNAMIGALDGGLVWDAMEAVKLKKFDGLALESNGKM